MVLELSRMDMRRVSGRINLYNAVDRELVEKGVEKRFAQIVDQTVSLKRHRKRKCANFSSTEWQIGQDFSRK